MKMRSLKIVLIAVFGAVALGFCVLLGIVLARMSTVGEGTGVWSVTDARLVQEKEFAADDISRLKVHYTKSDNDVFVYESDTDTVIVREYANFEPKASELAEMALAGGTLTVTGPKRSDNLINLNRYMYTEIWLPAEYTGDMEIATVSGEIGVNRELAPKRELKLSSTSGDISTEGIRTADVTVTSTSGEVRLGEVTADRVEVKTTSGDIRLERADAELSSSSTSGEVTVLGGSGSRRLSTTSGDIRVLGADGSFELSSTSGRLSVEGENGCGDANTASGDVSISLEKLTGDITVHTTSGEVELGISEGEALEFSAATSSGEINTFFDDALSFSKKGNRAEGSVGSGSRSTVKMTTSSGDIRVKSIY